MKSEITLPTEKMPSDISYSPQALRDLDEVFAYISGTLNNKIAANSTVNGVLDTVSSLSQFPESGTRLLFDGKLDSGYRYVRYKHYLVFYHLRGNSVFIDRVLYAKQNYEELLK